MRPRTCYSAQDLTDGRKEETDAPSATAETFVSLPEGKKIPVAWFEYLERRWKSLFDWKNFL